MPIISVIVPIYNAEQYLKRCLNSILSQSFQDFELILVNDGSIDNSGKICDEYAQIDSRVIVIHKENEGASIARKDGLTNANGEYIAFVDADDYVDSMYIEKLYSLIIQFNVSISACCVQRVREREKIDKTNLGLVSLVEFDELMSRFFKYEFWGFPGKLYKKSIFKTVSFPIETLSEDYFVMSQIFIKERKMVYLDCPLYNYEYHTNSLSHTKISNRAFEEFNNVKSVYELITQKVPMFSSMAMSNVVESCLKLHSMIRKDKSNSYLIYDYQLKTFLRQHLLEILFTKHIFWKLKILVIYWVILGR